MTTTPNMGLSPPSPSVTPGPTWAQDINDCLDVIDEHDHSTGRGVAISPAGMNINATIEMNENDLSEVNSVLLVDRSADISLTRGLYVKNGEFFYKDASGNAVQLTSGGSIAGTTGSFTGLSSPAAATYSSSNKRFTWTYDSSKFARMAQADLDLYPYDASTAYTKAITLKAPTGLEAAAAYSLTLPTALPASAEIMTIDNAGLVDHASISGTSNQVTVSANATAITLSLPSTVATTILQAGSGTVGAPSLSFSTDPDTGFYRSSGQLNAAVDGVSIGGYSAQGIYTAVGTASLPSLAFIGDADTGVYHPAANQVGISVGGAQRGLFSSGGLDVTGHIAATGALATDTSVSVGTSLSVGTTAAITGALTAGSLNLDGGGVFKTKIFTGSLAASGQVILSVGATPYGAFGYTTDGSTIGYSNADSSDGTNPTSCVFSNDSGTTSVRVNNKTGSTKTYTVVVFHA